MSEIYSYTVPHSGVNTTYYFEDTDLRNRISDAEAYVGYTDSDIAGLEVDYENNTFTRLAGAVGKSGGSDFNVFPTYAGMRRCILADDGTVVAYYGDSGYVEDGSAGQCMVEIPKFYYKVVPMKLQKQTKTGSYDTNRMGYHILKARYYISATPKDGFKVHPLFVVNGNEINYAYMSAYEGCIYDVSANEYLLNDEQTIDYTASTGDKLSSISGAQPCSGRDSNNELTVSGCRQLAANRGAGWYQQTVEAVCAIYLLFIVEYGNCNIRNTIGMGVSNITDASSYNCSSFVGSTSSLGNTTGRASATTDYTGTEQTDTDKTSISYRGIENFYSNIFKWVDGVNIYGDGTNAGGQPYVCNNMSFADQTITDNYIPVGFTLTHTSGYIKYFGYGKTEYDWLFMVSDVGGNSSVPVGGAYFTSYNLQTYGSCIFGGSWSFYDANGYSWGLSANQADSKSRSVSARLMYLA